jgi:hypothetical protein
MGTTVAKSMADPTLPDGRLTDACGAAQRLHVVLEDLIQHRDTRHDNMGRMATVVHASQPWNAQVAYLIFDLGKMVRALEGNLHLLISGTVPERGGSDENTQLALRALPSLALAVDEQTTRLVAGQIENWCVAARTVIGEVEPLSRLPRPPGGSEPRCPWCDRQSLRIQIQAGIVRCVNPVCLDDDGDRPRGRADVLDGVPFLLWQNGATSHWRS